MKSITTKFFLLALFVTSIAFSQSRVKERDVIGTWKFHLNLDKEVEEEMEDEDDSFGKAFAVGILKTVNALVKEADITFEFKKNHILKVTQSSWEDDDEIKTTETYRWKIDRRGRVVTSRIGGDGHFNMDNDDDGWMLKKGKLVSVDRNKKIQRSVWMEKVKR